MARKARCFLPWAAPILILSLLVGLEGRARAQHVRKLKSGPVEQQGPGVATTGVPLGIAAKLSVSPKSYKGTCPAELVFKGEIRSSGSGTVQYRFVRSDGSRTNVSTLSFFRPGVQTVEDTWQTGDSSSSSHEGWEVLEVVSPVTIRSNKATFRVTCTQEGRTSGRGRSR